MHVQRAGAAAGRRRASRRDAGVPNGNARVIYKHRKIRWQRITSTFAEIVHVMRIAGVPPAGPAASRRRRVPVATTFAIYRVINARTFFTSVVGNLHA
jgi:hypothetical protein